MIPLLFALLFPAADRSGAGQPASQVDGPAALVLTLERAAAAGNRDAILALAIEGENRQGLDEFAATVTPAPSRVVIKERDRVALDNGQRLLLEVFTERGIEGRVATWRVDVRPRGTAAGLWQIVRIDRVSVVSGLYRLSLDESRQFDVHNLTVQGPDLTLTMASGSAFLAHTPEGPTAIVLVGRGQMKFAPPDAAERTQLHIFAGGDALHADFDGALIRLRPSEFDARFQSESLIPHAVSGSDLRRAGDIFEEFIGKTFQVDLTDLSRERWSLVPSPGDLVAEVRTRRYGSLTYTRSGNDAEDVSLFDRKRRRNISVYASAAKLAARGRFYSEDDLVDYDVLSTDVESSFAPDRQWIDGTAMLRLKVRAPAISTLTLRLAESLSVRGVYSPGFGRLLHLRIVGQNSLIVNLPTAVGRGDEFMLLVVYGGRLEPQTLDREAIALDQDREQQEPVVIPLEPRYIYSNRSYWYPQSTVTDYANARLRITVPADYDVVASGTPAGPPAPAPGPVESGARARKLFVFESDRPIRYLACVISRFNTVTSAELNIPSADPSGRGALEHETSGGPEARSEAAEAVSLVVQANPRQASRGRAMADRAAAVFHFYSSIVGDAPYTSFTLALSESDLPGGHSPAYFVLLNQTLPMSSLVWRNDPVSFDNYPTFFLAHEVAHQWWGQAIGWKNYHEQWLSEGFAQYFAALYAEKERGPGLRVNLMRQMRRWAIEASPQGPIYLGYRLGHIKDDRRVFRAIIYNKAAMVLHMLRRLIGDDAFFSGLRRFYSDWRFKKAGTDDFRVAMEAASSTDLRPFFEAWIYGTAIPRLRFTYEVNGSNVTLKFEHRAEVAPLAVTVSLTYENGDTEEIVVPVVERSVSRTVPLKAALRSVEVNQDQAAVAEFDK